MQGHATVGQQDCRTHMQFCPERAVLKEMNVGKASLRAWLCRGRRCRKCARTGQSLSFSIAGGSSAPAQPMAAYRRKNSSWDMSLMPQFAQSITCATAHIPYVFCGTRLCTPQNVDSQKTLPPGGSEKTCFQSARAEHHLPAALAQVGAALMQHACHMLNTMRQPVLSMQSDLHLLRARGAHSESTASFTRRSMQRRPHTRAQHQAAGKMIRNWG